MRRTGAIVAIITLVFLFLPLFLLSITAFYESDELLRLFLVHFLQNKVGRGVIRSSGALVSLGNASFSFGCGGGGGDGKVTGGSCWNLEMRHLHIGNVPRNGSNATDDWNSPYSVHLNRTYFSVSGPAAYLSLLQLAVASSTFDSPSLPRIFCNGLDFVVGFRVRSLDILDIDGLSVYIEDDEEQEDGTPIVTDAVIMQGLLKKLKGAKFRYYDFVLERSRLSWYEPNPGKINKEQHQFEEKDWETKGERDESDAEAVALALNRSPTRPKKRNKSRGSLRLFASSSVEVVDGDKLLELEVITDKEYIVIRASSIEERDAWFDALSAAISDLQQAPRRGGGGNASWLEALLAEAHSRKVKWRRWERRQRQEWKQRWHSKGDNGCSDNVGDTENEDMSDGNGGESAVAAEDDANGEDDEMEDNEEDDCDEATFDSEGGGPIDFLSGIRNLHSSLDKRHSSTKHGKRFEDALEWRIGRLAIRHLALHIDDRHWSLDENGWSLRGFVGSSNELRRRLRYGLGPKLLVNSGGRAIKTGISSYTGKEEYVFGDLTKSTVTKVGTGVADAVYGFTGKEEYEFGDITKTAVTKMGAGVADAVHDYTGKEKYEFGDITKTTVTKVGAGVADAVHDFTGKEKYEFGDVMKTVFAKLTPRRSKRRRSKSGELNDKHAVEL